MSNSEIGCVIYRHRVFAERKPVLVVDVLQHCIVGIIPFAVPLCFRGRFKLTVMVLLNPKFLLCTARRACRVKTVASFDQTSIQLAKAYRLQYCLIGRELIGNRHLKNIWSEFC